MTDRVPVARQDSHILDQERLEAWGHSIGATVRRPAVLALEGPLGAGKSTLARSVARGAGIQGPLPSPTFNLLFRYESPDGSSLYHLDLYRLDSPREVEALGWEELFDEPALVLIEWPERAAEWLPGDRWHITLTLDPSDPDRRGIGAVAFGAPPALPPLPGPP